MFRIKRKNGQIYSMVELFGLLYRLGNKALISKRFFVFVEEQFAAQ
jgi:hypothetical protein